MHRTDDGSATRLALAPGSRSRSPEGRSDVGGSAVGRSSAVVSALLLAVACGGSSRDPISTPTGSLTVSVSGLPGATNARISLSGPNGYSAQVTGSSTLSGLVEGSYTLGAGYVSAQNLTWTASVSSGTVGVVANDTAQVTVTYASSAGPTANVLVAGTQVIQSTQRSDGTVPMVANRAALIRVFLTATAANTMQPAVRLRLFQGATVVDSLDVPSPGTSVPLTVDTSSLGTSWNVLVPANRVQPGMAYQVVADPTDLVPETDENDNRFPGGSATRSVTVQTVPAFAVRFVPVKQSSNNLTGNATNANQAALIDVTARMFPLSTVTTNVRSVYVTGAPPLAANDSNGAWGQILGEISTLRDVTDQSGSDYVGVVPTNYGSGIAGLGYIGYGAAIAWDKNGSAPGVIAHELGHNFGRNHAPCGGPSNPDPGYPYVNGNIGAWGLDLPALVLKAPGSFKDLMSYCNPAWISDYNYLAVLTSRGTGPSVAGVRAAAAPGLLVWGRIVQGRVILEPSFVVTAPAKLPTRPGPNVIEGFTATGGTLFRLSFEGERVADLPHGEERHFSFVVPLTSAERASLVGLRLTGLGLTAVRTGNASLRAGAARPVTLSRSGGDTEITWDASYPMALVRDGRTGEILSFARGGSVRLPSGLGRYRVELSEGVTSTAGITLTEP